MPERLDRESIAAHLANLGHAVETLRARGSISEQEIAASTDQLWFVAYGLQLAVQNLIDIAIHLVVALSGIAPDDYRSALEALGSLGVLEPAFAADIAPMAGLHNVLVHGYLRLDAARLADALQRLDDFTRFAHDVVAFLTINPDL